MKTPRTAREADMTDLEALTTALYLAITAPTKAQSQMVCRMAEQLAARLTPAEVERCKAAAKRRASLPR